MSRSDGFAGALPGAAIVLAGLGVLLSALVASGMLTFSALQRAQADILSGQFALAGREGATRIEQGLRFGRPLDRFLGLEAILAQVAEATPDVAGVAVIDAAGRTVAVHAPPGGPLAAHPWPEIVPRATGDPVAAQLDTAAARVFLTPLADRSGAPAGVLALAVARPALQDRLSGMLAEGLGLLVLIGSVAAALLAVAAGRLRGAMARPDGARWRWMLFPVLILMGAQGAWSWDVLRSFAASHAAASMDAAQRVAVRVGQDVDRLAALGLAFDRITGLEAQAVRVAEVSDAVGAVEIRPAGGEALRIALAAPPPQGLAALLPVRPAGPVAQPLADGGSVVVFLDPGPRARALAVQVASLATIAAISGFVMVELFILLQILLRRAARADAAAAGPGAGEVAHLLARPVMFAFVAAWALPLSFLPLRVQALGGELFGLPTELAMALPISAEMGAALVATVLAGWVADRLGWRPPVLAGFALSLAGGLWGAAAADALSFTLARALTGFGYGLAWMGLQAFVLQHCPERARGRALVNLLGGILAGFIAGGAVGGILAARLGPETVLLASGMAVAVPLALCLGLMGGVRGPGGRTSAPADARAWGALLRSPGYVGVLVLSVMPFSVAQVGLLYFAVPVTLDAIGGSSAEAGRILMVYGLVVILLGPRLGRLVERRGARAGHMVLGGLIGGGGLAVLMVDGGLWGLVLAAAALSFCSALTEPARAAFLLALPAVRAVGPASAIALQRAADKLGQMLGPLVVAAAFTSRAMPERVALLGVLFALASLCLAAVMALQRRAGRA